MERITDRSIEVNLSSLNKIKANQIELFMSWDEIGISYMNQFMTSFYVYMLKLRSNKYGDDISHITRMIDGGSKVKKIQSRMATTLCSNLSFEPAQAENVRHPANMNGS